MQKVVIAEHSDVLLESLEKALQTEWEVHTFTDSYPVIDTMKYLNPEALILDLNLAPKDGLTILEELFPDLPPVILALTNFTSPYIEAAAESLGVGYMMRIPCKIDEVKRRLSDMYEFYQKSPDAIAKHLRILNLNNKLAGYRCLLATINFLKNNPNLMLKEVYPDVAKLCSLNDSRCVERDIRVAIHTAWENRDSTVWKKYFPNCDKKCPTNREFITCVIEKL